MRCSTSRSSPRTLADVAAAGLRRVGTSSHHGVPHTAADWSGRIALVVGSEPHGLPADTPVDEWVRIEHHGRAESLNVAMATTVLVFEAARARRLTPSEYVVPSEYADAGQPLTAYSGGDGRGRRLSLPAVRSRRFRCPGWNPGSVSATR